MQFIIEKDLFKACRKTNGEPFFINADYKLLKSKDMLRIAVQSKGRLFEDTMALLAEADIKLSTSKRTLLTQSTNFPVEILFLRDDDIPQCVASGVADMGIVGENEFQEREEEADIIQRLGFSKQGHCVFEQTAF